LGRSATAKKKVLLVGYFHNYITMHGLANVNSSPGVLYKGLSGISLVISAALCFAVNQRTVLIVYLATVVVITVEVFIWFNMSLFDKRGY
jgi:hypothetical protein